MEIVTQTAGAVTGFLHNPLRNTQLNDGDFKRESAPIERGNSPSLAPPAEPPKPATPRGPRNLKLRAALRLAKLHNLAIFPAKPNEKTPAFVGWQGAATSNAEAITKWWTENPDFNIGVSTQGLLVLDVDARKGGIENFKVWRDLMELAGDVLPKTLRVKTASGGLHYIFKLPHGVLIGNKTNRPVEGVDIRGNGGLIVGAGSTIKKSEDEPLNTYTILDDVPIAEAPEWLIEAIGRGRPKAASAGKRVAEETDEMVAKAEVWLHGRAPEEITEGNRDNGLYTVAAKLYDFGLRQATVQGMLAQYNADCVSPPMEEDDIERIATSAGRNRREPSASWRRALRGLSRRTCRKSLDRPSAPSSSTYAPTRASTALSNTRRSH